MAAKKGRDYKPGFLALMKRTTDSVYRDPLDLAAKAEEYFIAATNNGTKITLSGLRLYLGLSPRQWYDLKKKTEDFEHMFDMIQLAMCEYWEGKLDYVGSFPGSQYWLRCHGGDEWKDSAKQEIEMKQNITVTGRAKIIRPGENAK